MHSTSTLLVVVIDNATDVSRLLERLQQEPGLVIAGVTANCDNAVTMVIRTAPDLVLIDLDLPGVSCFDAARQVLEARPTSKILLTGELNAKDVLCARELRLRGAIPKSQGVDEVVAAVRRVAAGETCFPNLGGPERDDDSPEGPTQTGAHLLSTLTPRELETLRLIATGLSQQLIAERMNISIKTVDNHRSNLMNKLGIHDRVCLARFAIREGLVEA